MTGDEIGMSENLRIFDSHAKSFLHLGAGFLEFAVGRQRPGVAIEGENILAALDFAFRDCESLRGLMGVVNIVGDQFVVGIVGDVGLFE